VTLALVLMLFSALLVGVLAGCVGIGGVLLPPALVYVGGLDLHLATATSMWAFLFSGTGGTFTYLRRRNVDWRMVGWLGAGIVPTAFMGAWANVTLPGSVLMGILALLLVVTGAVSLLWSPVAERVRHFEAPTLLAVGAVVGFGSALTGTGGPILLVPILLLLRTPVRMAVGAGMAISLAVTISSTVGYVYYGSVDFVLGTALGLVAVVGVVAGARIAHAARVATLQRVVAAAILCTGLLIAAQTLW
jgi:uncharacterized membrane protein YfcA